MLTDTLDPNLKYVSSTKSNGTITQSGSTVTFSFGSLSVGQTVTASVTAQALEAGNLTDTATATSSLPDANPFNNTAGVTVPVTDPPIVVSAPLTTTSQTLTNQTVATFTHASGVEPVKRLCGDNQLGRCHHFNGHDYQIGQHVFGCRVAHLCRERHLHDRHHGRGTHCTTAAASASVDSACESRSSHFAWHHGITQRRQRDGRRGQTIKRWNKLTPDATGSYVNGTWSTIASMSTPRQYYATNVLPDGRVLVLGGVASDGTFLNTGEIYNPLANTWTSIAPFPESTFGNGRTMLLPDGTSAGRIDHRPANLHLRSCRQTPGPADRRSSTTIRLLRKFGRNLPTAASCRTTSPAIRRKPSGLMSRILTRPNGNGSMPAPCPSRCKAVPTILAAACCLPDGRVLQIGANSNTAIYTPANVRRRHQRRGQLGRRAGPAQWIDRRTDRQ